MTKRVPTRRDCLRFGGLGVTLGLAGCTEIMGDDDESEIQDTDGDGVIDSEDYAPRDPEVQEKSDVIDNSENSDCECPDATPDEDRTTETRKKDIWENFEEYEPGDTPDGWREDRGVWSVDAEGAANSDRSGRLDRPEEAAFISYDFENPIQPSEITFWFKCKRYDDQRGSYDIRDSDTIAMNITTGKTGNGGDGGCFNCPAIVVNANHKTSHDDLTILSTSPTNNRWYKTRFYNINWDESLFDVELYNQADELVAQENHITFYDQSAEAYDRFRIKCGMNNTRESVWVDEIGHSR